MKRSILSILIIAVCAIWSTALGQQIELEKTYKLDGKARRGVLKNVITLENGHYELYYVTKAKTNKVKFQIYTFDSEFNFVSKRDEEVEVEKIKEKYSWYPYKGELYYVDGISLNWNPAFALKLKKKRTTYKYDWFFLGYYKDVEVLEKVKPRSEEGHKYYAKAYFEDEVNGDLYIVAGVAPGLANEDANRQHTDLRLIKFDWDLNMVAETKIPFEFANEVAFAGGFEAPDPENPTAVGFDGGMIVFAPLDVPGKYAPPIDPNKSNFTYIEFDKDLNIVGRESFESPSPGWNISNFAWGWNTDGGREVFVYGPAALGKDKYHAVAQNSTKLKSIQLLHTSSGKVQYLSETDIDAILAAKKIPPSNKKTFDFDGKNRAKMAFKGLNNGHIVLYGEYLEKGLPSDFTAFEFDKDGKLVANYMRNTVDKIKIAAGIQHSLMENDNGVFWVAYEVADVGGGQAKAFPVISRIDQANTSIGDPLPLGREGNKQLYFIDPSFPVLNISADKHVYFGADNKGKNIWFCRVKL